MATPPVPNGHLAPSPVSTAPAPTSGAQMYAGRQLTSADVTAITEAGSKGGVFMVINFHYSFFFFLHPDEMKTGEGRLCLFFTGEGRKGKLSKRQKKRGQMLKFLRMQGRKAIN